MGPALHLPIYLILLCYSVQFYTFAVNPPKANNDGEPAFLCRSAEVWTRPVWPTNIRQYCSELLDNMAQTMPEVFDLHAPLHEFLPVGVTPADPDLIPVRTPWKLTYGPCTLAVTTLASISPGWVPEEVGPRCVDPHGYSAWFSIHDGAKAVLNHCLTEQKAGMSWTLSECILFFCSTLGNEN
ncbi:hypothetical protein N7G274_005679 [Stereocaulon virgatum]|uniref:Uncharacterized protein n=1 Tax=Stereocaulon virgatum TaxID=373712 RepID=A0ABR4AA17_9LECA